mmetsp:Transcript_36942/g.73105  ORF Transcript_36942/g.73105 Transcript_36942/m.73105 type:complete len:89 (-) Transcript_36942:298-564(-)
MARVALPDRMFWTLVLGATTLLAEHDECRNHVKLLPEEKMKKAVATEGHTTQLLPCSHEDLQDMWSGDCNRSGGQCVELAIRLHSTGI